ncbi:MAG: hypothetical protein EA409_01605 [Saprospirales bacterium]|nr:MAG: hypothetical protein EA409_01605 [Saprospirales bacterium]
MPDITLTTDWSDKSYSTGLMKGLLVGRFPHSRIFDITHSIPPFDLNQAAHFVKAFYSGFPAGTIHLVCVLPHYSRENEILFFEYDHHYFVGPNNGLFSLAFRDLKRAGAITINYKKPNPVILTLCNAVARLIKPDPSELELEIPINEKLGIQAVISGDIIKAIVTYIDGFGNLTLNVHKTLFDRVVGNRNFAIHFKTHDPITEISTHYMDVPYGELLCRFNSTSNLEVAMNNFSASEILEIKVGDSIQLQLE